MDGAGNSTLNDYASRLNDTPWLTVTGYAWAAFAILSMLLFVTPAHWHGPLKSLGLATPLLFFVAKDLAQLPDVIARLRALRRQRAGLGQWLAACLPPALVGLMRLDRALWRSFFCWLGGRTRPARPDGMRLAYTEQGAYSTVIALGLLSVFVEIPLDAAVLPLLIHDAAEVRVIHLLLGFSCFYTLVWLLGDRWRVRKGHHVLTGTHLDLEVGERAHARIALADIEDMGLLREPVDAWRRTRQLAHAHIVTITPFDKPNLFLRLRPGAGCTITHHGRARTGVRYVLLYLDRPEQLLAAVPKEALINS